MFLALFVSDDLSNNESILHQRCDGAHPACAQCVRAHKADGCAYDDGRGKTRTQALRERIMRLEAELERVRGGRGESTSDGVGAREDSVFLIDPHAPPPSSSASTSAGSEGTFGELDFADFGADGFVGSEIERPTTSLSDPSVSAYTSEPFSFDSPDSSYVGGVHRNRTIRPRDRQSGSAGGGLREPRERMRPSSGVFGYSANHPLVQQAQAQGFASPYQFQHGHSRTSSTGSPSPSSSTVGSIGGHGQNIGASPYSSYTGALIRPFSRVYFYYWLTDDQIRCHSRFLLSNLLTRLCSRPMFQRTLPRNSPTRRIILNMHRV